MRQRIVGDQRCDVRKLGRLRLQEFLAGGRVKEQITNCYRSSRRESGFVYFENLAAIDFNHGPRVFVGGASFQTQAAYRSDGRQCLSAEAKSGHAEEVFGI